MASEGRPAAYRQRLAIRWRYIKDGEPLWSWQIGKWDVGAGFFIGLGLGLTVRPDEFDLVFGPFALGGVR